MFSNVSLDNLTVTQLHIQSNHIFKGCLVIETFQFSKSYMFLLSFKKMFQH